jgi:four helix bundle protein
VISFKKKSLMNRFKQLIVWQKSIQIATKIYLLSDKIPSKEKYGLISQMTRSAISISSNIAEGAGRNTYKEYCHYLSIAQGSAFELETQLIIGQNIKYYTEEDSKEIFLLLVEVQNMLYSFQKSLQKKSLIRQSINNKNLLLVIIPIILIMTTLYFVLNT